MDLDFYTHKLCKDAKKRIVISSSSPTLCETAVPSRVQVGKGSDEIDQLKGWAGAVTPKPPVNTKKAKRDRRTGL